MCWKSERPPEGGLSFVRRRAAGYSFISGGRCGSLSGRIASSPS
jgi:hypothetical protein